MKNLFASDLDALRFSGMDDICQLSKALLVFHRNKHIKYADAPLLASISNIRHQSLPCYVIQNLVVFNSTLMAETKSKHLFVFQSHLQELLWQFGLEKCCTENVNKICFKTSILPRAGCFRFMERINTS